MTYYSKLSQEQILLLVILDLETKSEFVSFETIVHDAFTLCPEKFAFKKYPQWPDSLAIDRRLRNMRNPEGLIEGKAKLGFRLTPHGRLKAEQLVQRLENKVYNGQANSRRIAEPEYNWLNYIEQHPLYKRFSRDRNCEVWSKEEVYAFLKLPLEAPKRIASERVIRFINGLKPFNRVDINDFLSLVKDFIGRLK